MRHLAVLIFLLSTACSTPPSRAVAERAPLTLSKVETLVAGKSGADVLKAVLGEPDQIVPLKDQGADTWLYYEEKDGLKGQRLGIVVDRVSGILFSATWNLREDDALYNKANALQHFKRARFKFKDVSPKGLHYAGNEGIYEDSQSGISLYIDSSKGIVSSISFVGTRADRRIGQN
jgi:hypothetical protein